MPPAPSHTPDDPVRRWWATWPVRVVVSLAIVAALAWRLPNVSVHDLVPKWSGSTPLWLIAALAIQLGTYAAQTLRWSETFALFDRHIGFRRLLGFTLAGQFVSNILPTSFGGDVVRVARAGRDLDDMECAFAATALERLTGWIVLPAIGLIGLVACAPFRSSGHPAVLAFAIEVGTVVALTAILVLAGSRRGAAMVDGKGVRGYIGAVHTGVAAMARRPRRLAGVLWAGAVFQLAQCVVAWCLAHAIGLGGFGPYVALAVVPVVSIVQNLPIGIGGIGVRESAFVYFLAPIGLDRGLSLTLGLSLYALTVFSSVAGGPAFAAGYRTPDAAPQNPRPDGSS